MTRRLDRLNGLLRREISDLVAHTMKDPRLGAMVSITRVDTSVDMRYARIYVSVMGESQAKKDALRGLESASGFLRRSLRERLRTKNTPELRFLLDESIQEGARVLEVMRDLAPGAGDSTPNE